MTHITDPDAQIFATNVTKRASVRSLNDPWDNSPFKWILTQPSRSKGAIAEQLVADWCESRGFVVTRTGSTQADRIIQGHRVEIKMSTLWSNHNHYKFQQIRDQEYDYCFCLGISPFDIHAWFLPKSVLLDYVIGHGKGQHTGSSGSETAWFDIAHNSQLEWMKPYGPELGCVAKLIISSGYGSWA